MYIHLISAASDTDRPPYLEATVAAAAAARQRGDLEVFVNMSRMTVSADEPDGDDRFAAAPAALAGRTGAELVGLAGRPRPPDGLPAALLLPALGRRVDRPGGTIRLPFGSGRTSPIDTLTMAKMHAANRYNRFTQDVEAILGSPATGTREFFWEDRRIGDDMTSRSPGASQTEADPMLDPTAQTCRSAPNEWPELGSPLVVLTRVRRVSLLLPPGPCSHAKKGGGNNVQNSGSGDPRFQIAFRITCGGGLPGHYDAI